MSGGSLSPEQQALLRYRMAAEEAERAGTSTAEQSEFLRAFRAGERPSVPDSAAPWYLAAPTQAAPPPPPSGLVPSAPLDAALWYAALGWHVFPLVEEGKEPITRRGHLDATTDAEVIRRWWQAQPTARIGVHLRASGLIAIDVDVADGKPGRETLAGLERAHGPLPRLCHQRSGRGGEHIIMRDPSPGPEGWTRTHDTGGRCRGKLGPAVDVKCNGYIVVEPSGSYRWLALALGAPPPVPVPWIALLVKPDEAPALDGAGVEAWEASTTPALSPADDRALREALAALGPRGAGKSTTWQAIKLVCHDFGRGLGDDADGAQYLTEWSEHSGKPHGAGELARQVRRVADKLDPEGDDDGEQARGWRVGGADLTGALAAAAAPVQAGTLAQLAAISSALPAVDRYGADTLDFLDGDDGDEESWLVRGLVPEGLPWMLVGPPKCRKSFLMYYLAICVAAGVPALGRETRRGRVLVISREDGRRETRRRLKEIARALRVDLRQLAAEGWLRVDATRPLYLDRPDGPDGLRALDGTLAAFRPALVMIDSLSRSHCADENDRSAMAGVTNAWNDLCAEHRCAIGLLHHVTKSGEGGLIQRIRGTGDLAAALRVAVLVERADEDTSRISVDGNLADMAEPFAVRYRDATGPAGKEIGLTPMPLGAVRADGAARAARERRPEVLAAFANGQGYDSANALVKACGIAKGDVLATVRVLVSEGVLRQYPNGRIDRVTVMPPIDPGSMGSRFLVGTQN